MFANQPLSRRADRKRKADDGNDCSMNDRRRDTTKSSSKRLKTIGDYRAALRTKQVSSKVSTKISDFKKHLLRKEKGLTSQPPTMKPQKKVITLEEYRRDKKVVLRLLKRHLRSQLSLHVKKTQLLKILLRICLLIMIRNANMRVKYQTEKYRKQNISLSWERSAKVCIITNKNG